MVIAKPRGCGASARRLVTALLPLGSIIGVVGLIYAFTSPFLPLFLERSLHTSPVRTSAFLLLMPLASVFAATALGRLSDRPGARRRLLIVTALSGVLGYCLFAFVREYWTLLVVSMTLLAVCGSAYPQAFAFARHLIDRSGSSRGPAAMSSLRTLVSLSWVAGPPVAAFLLGVVDFTGLFIVAAVGYGLTAIIAAMWIMESAPDPEVAAGPDQAAGNAPARGRSAPPAPKSGLVMLVAAGGFVLAHSAASLNTLAMPLFIRDDLRGNVQDSGWILGLCAALEIPLMLAAGLLASRVPLRRLVLAGVALGAGYFLAVSLAERVWQVAVAQLLNASFIAAIGGLGITYFQDLRPGSPGRATTMFSNAQRIGAMLSGPLFGLAQHSGYRLAYVFGIGLCAAGLLAVGLAGVSWRPR